MGKYREHGIEAARQALALCLFSRLGQSAILVAMNRKAVLRVVVAAALSALALPLIALADDSAAATAAGRAGWPEFSENS